MASLRTICAIGAVVCALLSGGASIGGPVVHLKFNDTGSTTNVVNTGSWTTTVGMASSLCSGMTVTGRVGNCFRFTGSSGSRIRSEDGGPLFPTNAPFAIAYWVNYTSTLELATFGVGTVQTAYRTVWVEDHPSGAGKQSALCVNGALRSTSLTIRGQGWRHCVLNIYSSTYEWYVGGSLAGSGNHEYTFPLLGNGAGGIAFRPPYGDSDFRGDIDDFRVYTNALDTTTISWLATGVEDEDKPLVWDPGFADLIYSNTAGFMIPPSRLLIPPTIGTSGCNPTRLPPIDVNRFVVAAFPDPPTTAPSTRVNICDSIINPAVLL